LQAKHRDLKQLIIDCNGLVAEALCAAPYFASGDSSSLTLSLVSRNGTADSLYSIMSPGPWTMTPDGEHIESLGLEKIYWDSALVINSSFVEYRPIKGQFLSDSPYWLSHLDSASPRGNPNLYWEPLEPKLHC